MQIREHAVHPRLAPFVRLLWSMEGRVPEEAAPPQRVVPDGIVERVFHVGTPWLMRFADRRYETQPRAFAILQARRFIELQPSAATGFVAVRFHPWGGCHFLGLPVSALGDAAVPIEELWGSAATTLVECLVEAPTQDARVSLIQRFLLGRLERHGRADVAPIVRAVWSRRGRIRIDRLAGDLGMGVRSLERTFARSIGTTPKQFARLSRFLHGCELLRTHPGRSHAELALQAGYFDQSHLIRDFTQLAGMTPGEFCRREHVAALTLE